MNTTTLTGHIITVPAHLIPEMFDTWNMGDIRAVNDDNTISDLKISGGFRFNADDEIDEIDWTPGPGRHDIPEPVAPDTELRVWVPEIPQQLADELA